MSVRPALVALALSASLGAGGRILSAADAASAASAPPPHPASAHREISTTVPAAQAAYDLGLAMLYAFDVGQAREEFARVATLDPACAMARYGEALAEVTDINEPPDAAAIERGARSIAAASAAPEATPFERRLIEALALRFASRPDENARRRNYAAAMRAYVRANPADADALVETAFAIWNAAADVSDPANADLDRDLDAALALDPQQIGALHLKIHYDEEVGRPGAALGAANALASMVFLPGESHLDHMPGHIYDRVGDYASMTRANERAVQNDRTYFAFASTLYPDVGDAGVAYMRGYHAHDVEFVLYGLTTVGRDDDAIAFASNEGSRAVARVALRLHRWQSVLDSGTSEGFALAIATARLGRPDAARKLLGASAPFEQRKLVDAAAAIARGDARGAVDAYAAAYARTAAADPGDPKTSWAVPIGEGYGAALLRARRYAEAEAVFAAELKRFPNDPRLAFGLATARDARGESSLDARAIVARHWESAVPPDPDRLG